MARVPLPIFPAYRYHQNLSNQQCSSRLLRPLLVGQLRTSAEQTGPFAQQLMTPIGFAKLMEETKASAGISETAAFDLTSHPKAQSYVATRMLKLIADDIKVYAGRVNSAPVVTFKQLTREKLQDLVKAPDQLPNGQSPIFSVLNQLSQSLADLIEADGVFATDILHSLREISNICPETNSNGDAVRFDILRLAGFRERVDANYILGAYLSTEFGSDMSKLNPFLSPEDILKIECLALYFMLFINRVGAAERARVAVLDLRQALIDLGAAPNDPGLIRQLEQNQNAVIDSISVARSFIKPDQSFDPRLLVFEYLTNMVLRKAQVVLINQFLSTVREGKSCINQMLMGGGKTTVIAPLLALMLSDGNRAMYQVVPTPLLEMSRNVMRSRFSSLIPKQIRTFSFERSAKLTQASLEALFEKLDAVRTNAGVVVTTPDAVKSFQLKAIELLQLAAKLSTSDDTNEAQIQFKIQQKLVPILKIWKSGFLLLDEVDMLLHPLRSELNFPIGQKVPLDLSPTRWELPIHLLSIFFQGETKVPVDDILRSSDGARDLVARLTVEMRSGFVSRAYQAVPHFIVLDQKEYHSKIKPILAEWMLLWLQQQHIALPSANSPQESDDILKRFMMKGRKDEQANARVGSLSSNHRKILILAFQYLDTICPHILTKINRVSFGLLSEQDVARQPPNAPASRALVAVPFVGKDVPTSGSEFAHPDIQIGLTVLAYSYSKLRSRDICHIVRQMRRDLMIETGPMRKRPSSVLFEKWMLAAGLSSSQIPPLELLQVSDEDRMLWVTKYLRTQPAVIEKFLCHNVFPVVTAFQPNKISASGQELGGDILFGTRLGFSGTPSDLLPIEVGACKYEIGSNGQIVSVLTNPSIVSTSLVADDWNVTRLLRDIATRQPPFSALIDTGALITGLDSEAVARVLLQEGLSSFEGCVFLDGSDRQMVLLRGASEPVLLATSGVSKEKRFTFYDQVHTTGIDIKQAFMACAAVTLGKDMVFRDLSQGAYRMRGIGKGQTIQYLLIPEVLRLIQQCLAPVPQLLKLNLSVQVAAWLHVNSMESENLQFSQLSAQSICNVLRKEAFERITTAGISLMDLKSGQESAGQSKKKASYVGGYFELVGARDPNNAWLKGTLTWNGVHLVWENFAGVSWKIDEITSVNNEQLSGKFEASAPYKNVQVLITLKGQKIMYLKCQNYADIARADDDSNADSASSSVATFADLVRGRAVRVKNTADLNAVFESKTSQWTRELAPKVQNNREPRANLAGQAGVVKSVDTGDKTVQVEVIGTGQAWFTPEMLLIENSVTSPLSSTTTTTVAPQIVRPNPFVPIQIALLCMSINHI